MNRNETEQKRGHRRRRSTKPEAAIFIFVIVRHIYNTRRQRIAKEKHILALKEILDNDQNVSNETKSFVFDLHSSTLQ